MANRCGQMPCTLKHEYGKARYFGTILFKKYLYAQVVKKIFEVA